MSEKTASTGASGDERIEIAFEEAMRASEPERAGVLDRVCGGDVQMRAEVESLLRHARETRDFLESPLLPGVAALPMPLPEMIGPFRIIGVLGEGGWGVCMRRSRSGRGGGWRSRWFDRMCSRRGRCAGLIGRSRHWGT